MTIKTFGYTSFAMSFLEKILGTKFTVSGLENLSDQPTMFVANHFTRSETFFVPYIIYKKTGKQARSLADSKLYVGLLGKYLRALGTISTKSDNRDNVIIGDLIKGKNNWIIYPEGSMIKSKNITRQNLFISNTPYRTGPVRTGSAVLALKSELYRQDLIEAYIKKDHDIISDYKKNYQVEVNDNLKKLNTVIVPLSISYYPIRPGKNKIQEIAYRLIKKIPQQIQEELEIEGNILMTSQINIHFGEPINVADYVKNKRLVINQIPIIKKETKNNFILRYYRSKLTSDFMDKIYSNVQVNLDHIFIASLLYHNDDKIDLLHLKKIIYFSAILIVKSKNYFYNSALDKNYIYKIFSEENFPEFDDVYELAIKQNIITKLENNFIKINKACFERAVEFHEIRLENTLHVIANEFFLLENANALVKRVCKMEYKTLSSKIFNEIYTVDQNNFLNDYAKYYDKNFSKEKNVGKPFFLDGDLSRSNHHIGVVLCHGYKSAPQEVEFLAKFINSLGFKVYAVRLKGHGTSPLDHSKTTYQDWYDSLQVGYCALASVCSKVVVIGFSTGGLLSLLMASQKNNNSKLSAIISINSALKLVSIASKLAHGVELWNDLLKNFSIEKGRFEFVDDQPENPHLNYSRNYISAVNQLELLMAQCDKNLANVKTPALVIQGDQDPVVDPISGQNIYNKINSSPKFLSMLEFKNHVIIYSNGKEKVFNEIKNFLIKLGLF